MAKINKVSIELKANVYATFRALNSTVYQAVGEFVDNALQSYYDNRTKLNRVEKDFKLKIFISFDLQNHQITVVDNAAGIDAKNYTRAFEPAHIPTDTKGLHEFGMGMKTAAVWLANTWTVTTKALGESVEREMTFDLDTVIEQNREDLDVIERSCDVNCHYTRLILSNLFEPHEPSSQIIAQVKKNLGSTYRLALRNGDVEILVNEEPLTAPEYGVLVAPYYKTPKGENVTWKKNVNISFGKYSIKGFVALLDKIQNGANGFVLMRRGRGIVGADENRYMPPSIFGSPGTFRYKRLFGELEIEGFEVSFNKNAILDYAALNSIMDLLRIELAVKDFNLLGQADNYRQRSKEECEKISKTLVKSLEKDADANALTNKIRVAKEKVQKEFLNKSGERAVRKADVYDELESRFMVDGENCILKIGFVKTDKMSLYSVLEESCEKNPDVSSIFRCSINLSHPFFAHYKSMRTSDDYMPIVKIFETLVISEINVRKSGGVVNASTIRLWFNQLISQ